MVKKLMASVAAASAAYALAAPMAASAFKVEQIQAEMPEITIYYSSDRPDSKVEVMLDHKVIAADASEEFVSSGIKTNYYILVDDSGSVTREQMNAIKQSLRSASSFIRPTDAVKLISVGTLETVFSGSISDESYVSAVDSFTSDKQETFLYEAMKIAGEEIFSKPNSTGTRNVIVAVSDGFNEAVGKTTYSELTDQLKMYGVPLYAMGLKDGATTDLDSFGELARSTGGDMMTFSASECEASFAALGNRITGCRVIKAKADNNITGVERSVSVRCPEEEYSGEFSIVPMKWIPDETAPEILSFDIVSANQLLIRFSENVVGADDPSNYVINGNDSAVKIVSASYTSDGKEHTATLTTADTLYTSDYTVSAPNITDHSNEKNKLVGSKTLRLKGEIPEKVPEDSEKENDLLPVICMIAGGIAALAVLTVVIVRLLKNKDKQTPETGTDTVSDKTEGGNIHVMSGSTESNCINLILEDGKELRLSIKDSVTVGRSQNNDVYFDDLNMSRYHFSIDNRDGRFILRDHGSLSGTLLNGEAVTTEGAVLSQNDVITAGKTRMSVRW